MSNNTDLNINRSLELLANLKQTAAKFAKREEQLSRDFGARRLQATRKTQSSVRHTDAQLQDAVAHADARYKEGMDRIKAVYDKRRARIQKYSSNTLRNLPHRAQEEKRRWMGDLQMKNFLAQKKLNADLAAADGVYGNFTGKLDINQASLVELEKRSRKAFAGYGAFKKLLRRKTEVAPENFNDLSSHFNTARLNLDEFEQFPLPKLFAALPLAVFIIIALGIGAGVAFLIRIPPLAYIAGGGAAAVLIAIFWTIYEMGAKKAKPTAVALANAMVAARGIMTAGIAATQNAAGSVEQARQKAQQEFDATSAETQSQWTRAENIETDYETKWRGKLGKQTPRLSEKIDRIIAAKTAKLDAERAARLERYTGEASGYKQQYSDTHEGEVAVLAADEKVKWDEIAADWQKEIVPIYNAIGEMNATFDAKFPAWGPEFVQNWEPSLAFVPAAKFGKLDLDLAKQPGGMPRDPRLALPGAAQVSLPASLSFPNQGSILFETNESAAGRVSAVLNNIILRLLAITPPGKLSFTIIDPVGLGESFAGLMHLADYEESIINRRIWTQRDQIEERLAELSEHIEKVIQMYLRNEYATITEYNEKAGSVAEKYHFLVVADFPANFSEVAAKRLQSIIASGPRCGVFTLLHWDQRQGLPDGLSADDLRNSSICIRAIGNEFALTKQPADTGATLSFDKPPVPEVAVELSHKIGKASIDSNRVEVPFTQIAPKPDAIWADETTSELRVPVGRTGATKLQYLAIGKGTRQHALFAGKTGSGKSTLFHVIITNLALHCSPEQVEFYLIDFKKGVEFKCYASKHLPHAKVVAIESDREFALSVLQRVDAELKRRGDMFRKLGVQDVAGYKRAGGTEPMPRSLLLIDEFQEFFVEDDTVAQTASLLFDRIVRQGRAFGIHVLLGSQTLGGAYSLARATLGQMVIRVALQCNEADAYLIMDENNSAPRLLSRPGEGIYNDAAGAMEGNSPFQVVWLPDEERDAWLDKVTLAAEKSGRKYASPIVFEGNAPSDISENDLLRTALDSTLTASPVAGRAWLGAPNSIKGPTEAIFQRQSGSHLLIVGQREEASLNMVGMSMLALAAQYPKEGAKFVVLHGAAPGSDEANFMETIVSAIPQEVKVAQGQDITALMDELATELKTRGNSNEGATAPQIFLFIHGLQKYKKLRQEDDFSFSMSSSDSGPNPSAQFNEIVTEGASNGIHIIAAVDTLNSVNRFLNRKALTEFEMRVVFQMSANDSASLIDSPKASNLGLHRAIYFNEHEGSLETFRPYATPDSEWIRQTAAKLREHHTKTETAEAKG